MNYKTELMEQIISSPESRKIIDYISPIYGEAYAVLWILQAVGVILDESESFPDSFLLQVTPHTATWSLSFWEKEYGIVSHPEWSIERRQNNLMSSINYRAPINPKKIETKVSGVTALPTDLKENTGKNKFSIVIRGYVYDKKDVIKSVDRAKPAHLIYDTLTSELIQCEVNEACATAITMHENYTLSMNNS